MTKGMIKPYALKSGEKKFMFQLYLGVDPMTGKEVRTTRRGFQTKKDAELAIARLRVQFAGGEYAAGKKRMKFSEVYDAWLPIYEKSDIKENTYIGQRAKMQRHILPKFGHMYIDKISTLYCQSVVLEWSESYSGLSNLISLTTRIIDFARVVLKIVKDNPMNDVIRPVQRNKEVYESPHYDKDQLAHFMRCVEQTDAKTSITFRILAYTGVRRGELCGLQWSDYDEVNNTLSVNRTAAIGKNKKIILHPPKSAAGIRTISLDPETGRQLREWKRIQRTDMLMLGYSTLSSEQHIISDKHNKVQYLSYPNDRLKVIRKDFEIDPINIHGLRHTHCTLLIQAGASFKEVQDRLGWANADMLLKVYNHVNKKSKAETGVKFANFIN